jgi:hypothetical protein
MLRFFARRVLVLVVLLVERTHTTGIYGRTELSDNRSGEDAHPQSLVGGQRLVERCPGVNEFLQIGRPLSHGIGARTKEPDGINFTPTLGTPFCQHFEPAVPHVCTGTYRFLDSRPILCLLRRQLQRAFDRSNAGVGDGIPGSLAQPLTGLVLRVNQRRPSDE